MRKHPEELIKIHAPGKKAGDILRGDGLRLPGAGKSRGLLLCHGRNSFLCPAPWNCGYHTTRAIGFNIKEVLNFHLTFPLKTQNFDLGKGYCPLSGREKCPRRPKRAAGTDHLTAGSFDAEGLLRPVPHHGQGHGAVRDGARHHQPG